LVRHENRDEYCEEDVDPQGLRHETKQYDRNQQKRSVA
jgi:hypothetical protein